METYSTAVLRGTEFTSSAKPVKPRFSSADFVGRSPKRTRRRINPSAFGGISACRLACRQAGTDRPASRALRRSCFGSVGGQAGFDLQISMQCVFEIRVSRIKEACRSLAISHFRQKTDRERSRLFNFQFFWDFDFLGNN